jgi:hypothetical protein
MIRNLAHANMLAAPGLPHSCKKICFPLNNVVVKCLQVNYVKRSSFEFLN